MHWLGTNRIVLLGVAAIAMSMTASITTASSAESVCARFGDGAPSGRVKNAKLTEISGLVASRRHPGVYWTHNDSGGKPEVFALSLDGTDLGSYALPGATATDWEDIGIGPKAGATGSYLYAADIGDNAALLPGVMGEPRDRVTIYRVAEPAIAPQASGTPLGGVERFELVYPGGPEDAEALFVDPVSGDLVIITKSVLGRSRILVAAAAAMINGGRITMTDFGVIQIVPAINPTSTFPGTFVTGADISADGSLILVRTYQAILAFARAPGQSVPDALRAVSCDAPQINEAQGEAVAIATDASKYVTISEGNLPAINVFPIMGQSSAAPSTTSTTTKASVAGDLLARTGVEATIPLIIVGALLAVALVYRRLIGRDGEI